MSLQYLTNDEITYIHERVLTRTGGVPGIRDLPELQTMLTRIRMTSSGREFYNDLFGKAGVLLRTIVGRKPFQDGNKRAGIAAAAIFLYVNGQELFATDHDIVDLCQAVERGDMGEDVLRGWFRDHTALAA